MTKLKKEAIVENGMKMNVDYYSEDGETITATVKTPVSDPDIGLEEPKPEASQLDRIEAQTAYIAMMMDGGDI